jgi:hypothetical protein
MLPELHNKKIQKEELQAVNQDTSYHSRMYACAPQLVMQLVYQSSKNQPKLKNKLRHA